MAENQVILLDENLHYEDFVEGKHYALKEWKCGCQTNELQLIGHGFVPGIYQFYFECVKCQRRWLVTSCGGKYSVEEDTEFDEDEEDGFDPEEWSDE